MVKLTLIVFILGCVTQSVISQGWLNWQGKEYQFITTTLTYTQAEADCIQKGSVLASVVNTNESAYITSQINDFYWFGLYNTQTTLCTSDCAGCPATSTSGSCQNCYNCRKTWTWKDGKPMNWLNWKEGQPNDGNQDGRCGKINGDGTWYDDICGRQLKYICKKDPTTTTQSTTTTTSTTTRPTTTTTIATTTTTRPTTSTTTTTTRPTTTTTTTTTTRPTTTTTRPTTTTTASTTTTTAPTTSTTATGPTTTTTTAPTTTTKSTTTKGAAVSTTTTTTTTTTTKAQPTKIVPVSADKKISFAAAVGIGVGVLVVFSILIACLVICCACCKRNDSESKYHSSEAGLHDRHNPTYDDHDYSNDSTLNKHGDKNSLDKNTMMYNSIEIGERQGHDNQAYTGLDTSDDNKNQYTNYGHQDEADASEVVEVENHPDTTTDVYTNNEEETHNDSSHDMYAQPEKRPKVTENSDTESGNINGDENNHVELNSQPNVPPPPPVPPMNM